MIDRVDKATVLERLTNYPFLQEALTTGKEPVDKWVESIIKKDLTKWSLIVGWLSVEKHKWDEDFRPYVRELNCVLDLLQQRTTPTVYQRIAEKIREKTSRDNIKGTLGEVKLAGFLASSGIPFELERCLNGKTNVDISAFTDLAQPVHFEVQWLQQAMIFKERDQKSASYGAVYPLNFGVDFERMVTRVYKKTEKFTEDQPTFVVIDCTEEPTLGNSIEAEMDNAIRWSWQQVSIREIARAYRLNRIHQLVDGVMWFYSTNLRQMYPEKRGIWMNPASRFSEQEGVRLLIDFWLSRDR